MFLFLPPIYFNSLSLSEKESHQWVTKHLNVISWDSGSYLYWFISQIFIAIKVRFPIAIFYAKGKEKTETLQKILQKDVTNLETLLFPKFEEIFTPVDCLTCSLHTSILPFKQKKKHCAKRKAQVYFYWITLPLMSRRVERALPSHLPANISPNLTVCSCIASDNQFTVTFLKKKLILDDKLYRGSSKYLVILLELKH